MKTTKLFLLTILCLLSPLTLLAQSEALYIYRNDGQFNAFFDADIDSITYSHYDLDSLYHTDWQMQVVHTVDSIYRIPLEVIDSVAFKPLEPILNSDVFPMTADHTPYILSADTLTFTMSLSTPKELRPRKGNVVVASYDCEAFPNGIIAKVTSVEETATGYVYQCEQASLDDVYDQIIYYGVCENSHPVTRAEAIVNGLLWDETFTKTIEASGTATKFTVTDAAAFEITLRKTPGTPLYAQITLANLVQMNVDFNATVENGLTPDPLQLGPTVNCGRIRIPQFPLIWFVPQMKLYGYMEAEGKISLDFAAHLTRRDKVTMTYADKQWGSTTHQPNPEVGVDVASLSMNGAAEVGLMPEIRLALNGSPTCIGINLKCGLKSYCDFLFDAKEYFDTGVYDALKETKFYSTFTRGGSLFAQAGFVEKDARRFEHQLFSDEIPVGNERHLLPLFTKPEYAEDAASGTAVLSTTVSRDLLFPVQVGLSLYDAEDKQVSVAYHSANYRTEADWGGKPVECSLNDLTDIHSYTCYPMVKLLGCEFRATPPKSLGINLCPDDNHPHAIDLGLSVKWACCNVGASTPEDYGGYYAWGEIEEKNSYTWENYEHLAGHDENGAVICKDIGSNISGTSYDVAHVKWGGNWHMPTLDEIKELLDICCWNWTTHNGVNGQLVIGLNGNKIFFPAAGSYPCSKDVYRRGSNGYYWSTTLVGDNNDWAYSLDFYNEASYLGYYWDCSFGFSVRPVTDELLSDSEK